MNNKEELRFNKLIATINNNIIKGIEQLFQAYKMEEEQESSHKTYTQNKKIESRCLNVKQAAKYMNVCEQTIYKYIEDKKIEHMKAGKKILILPKWIDTFVENESIKPTNKDKN